MTLSSPFTLVETATTRPNLPCPNAFRSLLLVALFSSATHAQTAPVLLTPSDAWAPGEGTVLVEDLDLDGVPDFAEGARRDENNRMVYGSVRVFSGADHRLLFTLRGQACDRFGAAVSGAGDVNRDGHSDLVVGVPLDDSSGINTGSAFVFSGKDGMLLHNFHGARTGDMFGSSVSKAGDVDQDGYADVIVGAKHSDKNGDGSGSATVFSGKDGRILHSFHGDRERDCFGALVGASGDLDRDGFADVLVGSRRILSSEKSYARIFSGKDGKILHSIEADKLMEIAESHMAAHRILAIIAKQGNQLSR